MSVDFVKNEVDYETFVSKLGSSVKMKGGMSVETYIASNYDFSKSADENIEFRSRVLSRACEFSGVAICSTSREVVTPIVKCDIIDRPLVRSIQNHNDLLVELNFLCPSFRNVKPVIFELGLAILKVNTKVSAMVARIWDLQHDIRSYQGKMRFWVQSNFKRRVEFLCYHLLDFRLEPQSYVEFGFSYCDSVIRAGDFLKVFPDFNSGFCDGCDSSYNLFNLLNNVSSLKIVHDLSNLILGDRIKQRALEEHQFYDLVSRHPEAKTFALSDYYSEKIVSDEGTHYELKLKLDVWNGYCVKIVQDLSKSIYGNLCVLYSKVLTMCFSGDDLGFQVREMIAAMRSCSMCAASTVNYCTICLIRLKVPDNCTQRLLNAKVKKCNICYRIGSNVVEAEVLLSVALQRAGRFDGEGFSASLASMKNHGYKSDPTLLPAEVIKNCKKCSMTLIAGKNCSLSQFKKIGLCFRCQDIDYAPFKLETLSENLKLLGMSTSLEILKIAKVVHDGEFCTIDLRKNFGPLVTMSFGSSMPGQLKFFTVLEANLATFRTNNRLSIGLRARDAGVQSFSDEKLVFVSNWVTEGIGVIVPGNVSVSTVELSIDGEIVGVAMGALQNGLSTYFKVVKLLDNFPRSMDVIW